MAVVAAPSTYAPAAAPSTDEPAAAAAADEPAAAAAVTAAAVTVKADDSDDERGGWGGTRATTNWAGVHAQTVAHAAVLAELDARAHPVLNGR